MITINCSACGKKLLERMPNGCWKFQFGSRDNGIPVVDMEIQGSIKMQCLRRSCRHINVLNFFPSNPLEEPGKQK